MRKILFLFLFLLCFTVQNLFSQAILNKTPSQIMEEYKDYEMESGFVNEKYCIVVSLENQDVFFWFKNKHSLCYRMNIYPYDNEQLNRLIKFYDSTYKVKDGDDKWVELRDDGHITVIILHRKGELIFFELFCKPNIIIKD